VVWRRAAAAGGLALIVATATMLLLLTFSGSPLLRILETETLDLRFRLRGVEKPANEIALVMVDDRSLDALGRWPLSRRLFAQAVQRIDQAGAKLIVFDLLFAEPEQQVSADLRAAARAAMAELPPSQAPELRRALANLDTEDPDGEFAAALRASGKVLLPLAFEFTGDAKPAPESLADSDYLRLDRSMVPPIFPLQPKAALMPIAKLAEAAAGLGHTAIAFDEDGAPRYDYLALPYDGDFVPSLSMRAVAAYLGVPWPDVGLALGDGVNIGNLNIPSDPAMRLLVNYHGPRGTFPTYSFLDLVQGRVPDAALRGHIVLVGASFIGLADAYAAPFGNTPLPGTERIANVIDATLQRSFIEENPHPWPAIVLGLVMLLGTATGIGIAVLPTRVAALAGVAPAFGWCVGAQAAFVHGLWLPVANPAIALVVTSVTILLFRYAVTDQQRRRIQTAFRHYLAPDLVNELADNPGRLHLGGQTRMLTIMFSDIRGFTSISETFKTDPQGLSRLINRGFLSPMTKIVMGQRGTIDKYMGDCIMAFWNAPLDTADHASRACATALAMLRELDQINQRLEQEAAAEQRRFVPIHVGIGLNTGECVVGNMGSDERFAYTAFGDAVNLASRLEGQSKTYHVPLVIGEATREAAPSWAALELDLIAVKGKQEAVRIYTLLGDAELAQSPNFQALAEDHAAMLAFYRAQDWASAQAALERCRKSAPQLAEFYDEYENRIAYFTDEPPGADWNGVFVAETK
jgi:adenylate cyclase